MEQNLALHILFSHKDVALVFYQRNVNYKESAEIIKGLFEQFDAQNFDFSEMSIEGAQKAVIKTVEANGGGIVRKRRIFGRGASALLEPPRRRPRRYQSGVAEN